MNHLAHLADRAIVQIFLLTRDESAFRLLYRRYKDVLWRLALRLNGGDQTVAADVTQDAWLRAVERLPQFRWESGLRTWLCGFVVMRSREQWRTELIHHKHLDGLERAALEPAPTGFGAEKLDLETAVAALPPGYRAVLTLHDIEGWKHHEIAELLGISTGTSKSQLMRARQALRRVLL